MRMYNFCALGSMLLRTGQTETRLQEKGMKNTAKIKLKNRIRKLLSDKRGFSLGELLAATVILLLASQVMTQGMAFATRMYNESLTRSHAKQLCST